MDGVLGGWQETKLSGSLLKPKEQQKMKYKTIGLAEDAADAELRNVTQMTDQLLETKECRFGWKLDRTIKAKWWGFARSFCIQPTKNNTSTKQLGENVYAPCSQGETSLHPKSSRRRSINAI